jgi:uncharacterized membrane protein
MDEQNLSLLVSVFKGDKDTDQVISIFQSLHKEKTGVLAAVAIDRETDGKIKYKDIGMSPKKGALSGLVIGAVVGVLTGGIGLVLGSAGALIGGLLGSKKYQDRFTEVRLHEVVAAMKPGESAIVAVVDPKDISEIEKRLESLHVEYFTAPLSADLAEKLEQNKDSQADADWLDQMGA